MGLVKTTAFEITDDPLIGVVYAAPGVGKTHCVGEFIEEGKENEVLIIDIDKSSRVVRNIRPNAHIVRIASFDDLSELHMLLKTNDPDWSSYKTIIFDTLTNGEQIMLWDILKRKGKVLPQIDHYGERAHRMRQFIQEWREIGRNVIFVCHEKESDIREEDAEGEEVVLNRKMPEMSGKLSILLCGDVDLVLRLCIREVPQKSTGEKTRRRVFQTFKTNTIFAKDRSGALNKFEPANLRHVFQKWYNMGSAKKEEKQIVDGQ